MFLTAVYTFQVLGYFIVNILSRVLGALFRDN